MNDTAHDVMGIGVEGGINSSGILPSNDSERKMFELHRYKLIFSFENVINTILYNLSFLIYIKINSILSGLIVS